MALRSPVIPLVSATLLLIITVVLVSQPQPAASARGFNPDALPNVITEEALAALPEADKLMGFSGRDYSQKDLASLSLPFLAGQSFDQNTVWPDSERLPEGFTPAEWLEAGKNPGLGVRELHKRGLTGQGVALAVFDKPILPEHQEFAGRLNYHQVAPEHKRISTLHFHGMAVASLLAGESCGVAPGVTIHYFAVPDAGRNAYYYSLAVEQLLELNRSLLVNERVRLVVISDGVFPDDRDWTAWQVALTRAKEEGVEVLLNNNVEGNGFVWGGAQPYLDRDDPSSYLPGLRLQGLDLPPSLILVPGDW